MENHIDVLERLARVYRTLTDKQPGVETINDYDGDGPIKNIKLAMQRTAAMINVGVLKEVTHVQQS